MQTVPQLTKQLNSIFTDKSRLQDFKKYLSGDGEVDEKKRRKYLKEPYTNISLRGGKLVYTNPHLNLSLEIVEDDDQRQEILDDLFTNDTNAYAKGVENLYKYVASKYSNITRKQVADFVRTKTDYQITEPIRRRANKPIISKYPNQLWSCDLIDLNEYATRNRGWRYILTVVDVFSRKTWLRKLKKKTAAAVRDEMKTIIDDVGVSPKLLLSDQGLEFHGVFSEFCKEKDIKQIFTRSHSPQANGITERANMEVRKIIHAFWVRQGNNVWFDILPQVEQNKNATFNSTVKGTPDSIYDTTKEEMRLNSSSRNPRDIAKRAVLKRAKREMDEFRKIDNLTVGDKVRVSMASLFANVRSLVKQGNTKQIVVNFSPQTFRVIRVIFARNKVFERKKYMLQNEDGVTLTKNGKPCLFYGSELLQFEGDEDPGAGMTMDVALKMNGVKRSSADVEY